MKNALIIIFNHRFDKNIDKLKKIYRNRFSFIYFLVPFYDGDDENVIPVYESSYCFQGYLSQAYDRLIALEAENYIFIGDDLILHPMINEDNISTFFNLDKKEVCISSIIKFNKKDVFKWYHSRNASRPFFNEYINWKGCLCSYDNALAKFRSFFNEDYLLNYTKDFFGKPANIFGFLKHQIQKKKFKMLNGGTLKIPYPLAYGYSDFLIVSRNKLHSLAHVSGVFSAMGLFVEIALPTAIVLTTERNKTSIIDNDIHEYTFKALWTEDEKELLERENNNNLLVLYNNWPQDCLFIHPVKLSRWEI